MSLHFPVVELVRLELTIFSVVENTLSELTDTTSVYKYFSTILPILNISFPRFSTTLVDVDYNFVAYHKNINYSKHRIKLWMFEYSTNNNLTSASIISKIPRYSITWAPFSRVPRVDASSKWKFVSSKHNFVETLRNEREWIIELNCRTVNVRDPNLPA